jgi:hypothetical protein
MILTMSIVTALVILGVSALTYTSRIHLAFKLATLPLTIVLATLGGVYYLDNLGAPLAKPLPSEFKYQAHVIDGDTLFVWISTEERGERLHTIPYERETAKALEEAKEEKEEGKEALVTEEETNAQDNGGSRGWSVEGLIPEQATGESK